MPQNSDPDPATAFTVHECDAESRPGGMPIETFKYARDAALFVPAARKLYAIRYRGRYYSLTEFRRLFQLGEIV